MAPDLQFVPFTSGKDPLEYAKATHTLLAESTRFRLVQISIAPTCVDNIHSNPGLNGLLLILSRSEDAARRYPICRRVCYTV